MRSICLVTALMWPHLGLTEENPMGYRGVGHTQYHQLYSQMHNQSGTHCCNDGDCRPTTAWYDPTINKWRAYVDGVEVVIEPTQHVQDAYGLNEFASVCAGEQSGYVFCFIPPNMSF